MNIVRVLTRMGGAARRAELLAAGIADHEIKSALQAGAVERPMRGCLTLPAVPYDQALARYFDARLTCTSAAVEHGIRVLEAPRAPHLELDANRGNHKNASFPHKFVRLHRSRSFEPGSGTVPLARAIDMASTCIEPLAQLVMLDHALGTGRISRREIDGFRVTPLAVRRWLADQVDPAAESVSETCARVALRAAGLEVQSQAPLWNGRRADFLVEGRLYVEVDGFAFHSDPEQFDADRARDRRLGGMGYRVVRFTYGDAVFRPAMLVRDVVRMLRAEVK